MNWLTSIFSSGVDKVVDSVMKGADNLFTSDSERLQLRNELSKAMNEYNLDIQKEANNYEAEITARNANDQIHGNFLTKSARPIFLYWIMAILTIMVFGGMAGYTIDSAYIDMIKMLSITAVTFFFGSKGIEIVKHGRQI
jgi:hypothetical protein